jgi:hypothetical protein
MILEVMMLMSKLMPNEEIIERLKDHITEWQINPTDENFKKILFNTHLLFIKHLTKGDDKKINEMLCEFKTMESMKNMFKATN